MIDQPGTTAPLPVTSAAVKELAHSVGADLVGIAPVERFAEAPAGHHPTDILPGAQSVVVCATALPTGAFDGPATSYHIAMKVAHWQLDLLGLAVARYLEDEGEGAAVAVPSDDPYWDWDAERGHGMGDLSHKHAAQAAGLGRLGKCSLLITPQLGNRVHLVSIVTRLRLDPDPALDWEPCPTGCTLCIRACPVAAIGGALRVDQQRCREYVMQPLANGLIVENCWACRAACPVGRHHHPRARSARRYASDPQR